MHFVYILRSELNCEKTYIGMTNNLERRLEEHNNGESRYTNMFKPWQIEAYLAFSSKKKAEDFEIYLKTGSGSALMRKHFI